MFKDKTFYHSHIRKAIIAFGTIFNDINIERKNSAGAIAQTLRVPLAYSTKQKFLTRIARVPDTSTRGEVALTLPRMGFEINGLNYDPGRKVAPINRTRVVGTGDDTSTVRSVFASAPWNMDLALYIFAKNQNDGLNIIEQVLPYFNPDFNVTINDLPEMGIKRDIKITLDNVNYEDEYEGEFANRISVIWTLNFTMRLNFYSHVANVDVIKQAVIDAYNDPELSLDKVALSSGRARVKATVDPQSATPADEYKFLEEFDEAFET
jgi:hypothetical protein|tara:strand:- start:882 stop:1676 length:795 start_codon:yes stop_codon:yes gene_type:complete